MLHEFLKCKRKIKTKLSVSSVTNGGRGAGPPRAAPFWERQIELFRDGKPLLVKIRYFKNLRPVKTVFFFFLLVKFEEREARHENFVDERGGRHFKSPLQVALRLVTLLLSVYRKH